MREGCIRELEREKDGCFKQMLHNNLTTLYRLRGYTKFEKRKKGENMRMGVDECVCVCV